MRLAILAHIFMCKHKEGEEEKTRHGRIQMGRKETTPCRLVKISVTYSPSCVWISALLNKLVTVLLPRHLQSNGRVY